MPCGCAVDSGSRKRVGKEIADFNERDLARVILQTRQEHWYLDPSEQLELIVANTGRTLDELEAIS